MPALSIAENLALGDPPVRTRFGLLADRRPRAHARGGARYLAQLDFAPDLDRPVHRLCFAERQLVAIAKALRRRCRIFILDEPTAALETREIERLFAVLARMKAQGTAIIYISHRLDEVVALRRPLHRAARRPGRGGRAARRIRRRRSGRGMTGRAADEAASPYSVAARRPAAARGAPTTSATLPPARAARRSVSRACSAAARDRILRRLFGVGERARMRFAGRNAPASQVRPRPSRPGIGMVPGERRLGLVMNLSVRDNILLPSLDCAVARRLDRPRGRRPPGRRTDGASRYPSAPAGAAGRRAVRRQPAEGDPRQMAGAPRRRAAARRADARHRRRRQGANPRADPRFRQRAAAACWSARATSCRAVRPSVCDRRCGSLPRPRRAEARAAISGLAHHRCARTAGGDACARRRDDCATAVADLGRRLRA